MACILFVNIFLLLLFFAFCRLSQVRCFQRDDASCLLPVCRIFDCDDGTVVTDVCLETRGQSFCHDRSAATVRRNLIFHFFFSRYFCR